MERSSAAQISFCGNLRHAQRCW